MLDTESYTFELVAGKVTTITEIPANIDWWQINISTFI